MGSYPWRVILRGTTTDSFPMRYQESLPTIMYRQNSASVIRDAVFQGVKLPRHTPVMNHLKDLQKTFCDTTKLTTSGRVPAQGFARPCVGMA